MSGNNTPRDWVQGTLNAVGTFAGAFTGPDGLKFTASAALHEVGNNTQIFALPLYAILHANKGFYHAYGVATLDTTQAMDHLIDLDGRYLRPANPKSVSYQFGFSNSFDLRGRKYVKPGLNNRVLGFLNDNGAGTLRVPDLQDELTTAIHENLTLSTANKFTFSNPTPLKLSLTVNSANGLVSGSLTTTDNILGITKARPRKLQGLIFRDINGITCLRGHVTGVQENLYMDVITPQL